MFASQSAYEMCSEMIQTGLSSVRSRLGGRENGRTFPGSDPLRLGIPLALRIAGSRALMGVHLTMTIWEGSRLSGSRLNSRRSESRRRESQ